MADDAELVLPDAAAWHAWLAEHHSQRDGVWLVLGKKATTEPTRLRYAEALEEALCHGWIDGQTRRRDEHTYLQRFTPRRLRSPWSRRNVGIVERLTAQGRMHAAGIAEVERAKADGRWQQAYGGRAEVEMPADLAAALDAEPRARAIFDVLTAQNRYAILYQVLGAKRPETRAGRIERFVAMLGRGETPYPQKRRPS